MRFRDDAERQAWSSAWDSVVRRLGCDRAQATEVADSKIEAMRERLDPEPQRSERGALERIEAGLDDVAHGRLEDLGSFAHYADDTAAVEAVIEAARRAGRRWPNGSSESIDSLMDAVEALDKKRGAA